MLLGLNVNIHQKHILLGYVPITDCFREYDTDLYLGKALLKTYKLSILDRIIY